MYSISEFAGRLLDVNFSYRQSPVLEVQECGALTWGALLQEATDSPDKVSLIMFYLKQQRRVERLVEELGRGVAL